MSQEKLNFQRSLTRFGTILALIVISAGFALAVPGFAGGENIMNILRQIALLRLRRALGEQEEEKEEHEPDDPVQLFSATGSNHDERIKNEAEGDAIGNIESERHADNDQEGRKRDLELIPADLLQC